MAESALETCRQRSSLPSAVCARLEKTWTPKPYEIELQVPSLLHLESLGLANIIYDPSTREITGLLDYEDCIGGDPLLEWAWMRYCFEHDGPDQTYFDFDPFLVGCGALEEDETRLLLYEPLPYLGKLRCIQAPGDRAHACADRLPAIVQELQAGRSGISPPPQRLQVGFRHGPRSDSQRKAKGMR